MSLNSDNLLCFGANLKTGGRGFLFWRNKTILFFSLQMDELRSLKMNNSMNIVDNYRPVQSLGSRKVKSSFGSTQIGDGIALKIPNVVLLLVLLLLAVFCQPWMIRQTRSSAKMGSRGCYSAQFGGRGHRTIFNSYSTEFDHWAVKKCVVSYFVNTFVSTRRKMKIWK